jgi:hypothetical protein
MWAQSRCRKITLKDKPQGTRRAGRSGIMWLDSVELLKEIGVGDASHRIGTSDERPWKRPRFVMDNSARRIRSK